MPAGRFFSTVRNDSTDGCALALLGLPDDTGVALNNGRPGAKEGPTAFRAALARYGTTHDAALERSLAVGVYDAGDIVPVRTDEADGDPVQAMHRTHERVTEALFAVHKLGLTPVCIGGGHDLTFPAVRALSQSLGKGVSGINVDAHLDVRETPGSGMPYHAGIEGGFIDASRFVEYGIGRFANTAAHCEWLLSRFGHIVTIDQVRTQSRTPAQAFELAFDPRSEEDASHEGFVSIDLDAIDGAHVVGVSAVNPCGIDVHTACQCAERAGQHPAVRHFDLMELSPRHDDGRTARIAALLFLHFVSGFAERSA